MRLSEKRIARSFSTQLAPAIRKIVAESVTYIGYLLLPATDLLNDETLDISIAKPFRFIKEDPSSICRPPRKVSKSRRAIQRRICEDSALVLPRRHPSHKSFSGRSRGFLETAQKTICVPSGDQSGDAEGPSLPLDVICVTPRVATSMMYTSQ